MNLLFALDPSFKGFPGAASFFCILTMQILIGGKRFNGCRWVEELIVECFWWFFGFQYNNHGIAVLLICLCLRLYF
jgi:hypothetical protein